MVTKPRRPWLAFDEAALRRDWGSRPPGEVALLLGRTVEACRCQARRLGLVRKRARLTAKLAARIRALHAAGASTGEAARRTGLHQSTASRFLRRLGLAPRLRPGEACPAACARERKRRHRLARGMGYRNYAAFLLSRRRLRYDAQHPGCATRVQATICRVLAFGALLPRTLAAFLGKKASRQHVRQSARRLVDYGVLCLLADGRYALAPRA